jgi:hypothetical protein
MAGQGSNSGLNRVKLQWLDTDRVLIEGRIRLGSSGWTGSNSSPNMVKLQWMDKVLTEVRIGLTSSGWTGF